MSDVYLVSTTIGQIEPVDTVGIVPSKAKVDWIFSISHPQVFEMRTEITFQKRWFRRVKKIIWVRTNQRAIELIRVVGPSTAIRGCIGTTARRWPVGSEVTLVAKPFYANKELNEDGSPVWDLSAPENL
jgi:hypothetical protein